MINDFESAFCFLIIIFVFCFLSWLSACNVGQNITKDKAVQAKVAEYYINPQTFEKEFRWKIISTTGSLTQ